MDRLLQQQWSGRVTDEQQAERWVVGDAKQLFGVWKQQQNEQLNAQPNEQQDNIDRQASVNRLVKLAALKKVVSQHMGEDAHSVMMEGNHRGAPELGVQNFNRSIKINFNVGDVVMQRNKGLNFQQKQGKVESIKNNIMVIKWEDGKTTEYPMNDTSRIFSELERSI